MKLIPDYKNQMFKRLNGWETPSFYLIFLTVKIHQELKRHIH